MSAHQRDMMLIDISREEIELKKGKSGCNESLDQTETAIASMADSMVAVGNSIKEGLACYPKLSCRNIPPPPQHYPYNHIYMVPQSPITPDTITPFNEPA